MPNPLLQNENQELLVVEAIREYSAGSGIDITSGVISLDPYISASIDSKLASADFGTYSANVAQDIAYVSANAGKTYYAGDNIGISDDYVISSKDWTTDISNASAYAYNQAVAQIPAPQDLSYMSGAIDTNSSNIQYISGVAITAHQDWTDTITAASSYAYNQATAQIPPQFDPTYMSGAIDTNSSDIQYISGVAITAHQDLSDYYTTANANALSSMLSGAIDYVSGQVPAPVDLSYISGGVDYVSGVVGDKLDATAFNIPASSTWNDVSTNVQSNSSIWNDTTNVVQTNSSTWNNPGTSLTGDAQGAVDYVYTNSGDIGEVSSVVQNTSATWNNKIDALYLRHYIRYDASSVLLNNANFKIEHDGQAYKNEAQVIPGATITGTYWEAGDDTEFDWNDLTYDIPYSVYFSSAPANSNAICVQMWDMNQSKTVYIHRKVLNNGGVATFTLPQSAFYDTANTYLQMFYGYDNGGEYINHVDNNRAVELHQDTIVGGYVPYLTQTSANATYQPIGNYATSSELEQVSGDLKGDIDYISGVAITAHQDISNKLDTTAFSTVSGTFLTAHQSLDNYYTKSETSGADELANAFANIPAGDADVNSYVQGNSATIDNVNSTVQTNSAQWAQGGGSVDTIPVVAISPIVTGFSGESAYLGIESTALNLSSYVPVSSIGYNGSYISTISGNSISSYTGRYAMTAKYANTADRAYKDRNSNEITSYYQPKLTIAGENGTITAINSSAVGASIPEGWELVAGAGISIVDDSENNQTIISATGGGGNPEVESYVQTNSASINNAVSTYETNSASYITQETDWTNTITAASSYAYNEAVSQIPAPFDPTYMSGAIDYVSGAFTGYLPNSQYETDSAVFNAKQDALTFATANALSTASNYGFVPLTGISGIGGSALIIPMKAIKYLNTAFYTDESAVNRIYKKLIAADLDGQGNYIKDTYQKVSGVSANEWNSNYETVNTNSATWNDATTTYQTNSATYLTEPNLEYNAVNEISGYNGSAIAQYGAEKQWLLHDDTLVHAANSAQYALGVNISAVAQLLGVDETVLFSGMRTTGTITLSEPADNFNRVKILYCINDGISNSCDVIPESTGVKVGMVTFGYYASYCREKGIVYTLSGNKLTPDVSAAVYRGGNNSGVTASTEAPGDAFRVNAVIGIGRKS